MNSKYITSEKYNCFLSGVAGHLGIEDILASLRNFPTDRIEVWLPRNPKNRKFNKGFATLTFSNPKLYDELLLAKEILIGGRIAQVMKYLSPEERVEQKELLAKRRVFISGKHLHKLDLQSIFEVFGPVEEAYCIKQQDTGKYKNYGFVLFHNEEAAWNAIVAGKLQYADEVITIDYFKKHNSTKNAKRNHCHAQLAPVNDECYYFNVEEELGSEKKDSNICDSNPFIYSPNYIERILKFNSIKHRSKPTQRKYHSLANKIEHLEGVSKERIWHRISNLRLNQLEDSKQHSSVESHLNRESKKNE